jgi:D-alanine--D-alanine ligase
MVSLALLLGGPSQERGISLNSARSVADHLVGTDVQLKEVIYFDRRLRAYPISRSLLYCNTPSDFDFKLTLDGRALTEEELVARLQGVDLVFPAIHGAFGEDGQLQALLESAKVPFIGTGASACQVAFDKFRATDTLRTAGIGAVPGVLVTSQQSAAERAQALLGAFPEAAKVVIKPAQGGSSIDVHVLADRSAGVGIIEGMAGRYGRVVIQPWITGTEMTTIVMQGPSGPVALIPLQIELRNRLSDNDIFDYRRKYLASNDSHYYCPPAQDVAVIKEIQRVSEQAFSLLGLRDFARIDSWLRPDGEILVSEINPISGMEQNSFLFISAAQLGMSHADILRFVVRTAARRIGIEWAGRSPVDAGVPPARQRVGVLFGGETAERQVSVLSGTNVWLKLLGSRRYLPVPYLLDPDGSVWQLSYSAALRHSVEEIVESCRDAQRLDDVRSKLASAVLQRLGLSGDDLSSPVVPPARLTMDEFLDQHDLVFIALHGGKGEDGTLQEVLNSHGVRYNGSDVAASRLCMDKYETGKIIAELAPEGIYTARRICVPLLDALARDPSGLWQEIAAACGASRVVVKPVGDGCSAGVVPLGCAEDLAQYLHLIDSGASRLQGGSFSLLTAGQIIELPAGKQTRLLFEEYIETDDIRVDDTGLSTSSAASLIWGRERDTGWVEVTVGVLGKKGSMTAMNPSITVASSGILSLEEKFMGGTGVNITPPPAPPLGRVRPEAVRIAKERIARAANALGMAGYGRVDAFMHRETGEIIVIEANSLPGLTPATVFYHQGLAEEPPLPPRDILEMIVDLADSPRT